MTTTRPASGALDAIEHLVVLMLENRSFDHLLGLLYADTGNVSPTGAVLDGLRGDETNPGPDGSAVAISRVTSGTTNGYYVPGADPGEGYAATNAQLFGDAEPTGAPPMNGFVTDFADTLAWEDKDPSWSVLPGTVAADIMAVFTPESLPVLSTLARGFAVCDGWFSSVPTETLPNRAFAAAATSQGHLDDKTHTFTAPSIFGLLDAHGIGWAIYGYDTPPLSRQTFTDITNAAESHFGLFADFKTAAAGALPAYTFLEPSFASTGNSEHPNYDVALGEQLLHDVYRAVHDGPGWDSTLLIVTYDEHGGCYDHVPPPTGAMPPDDSAGEFGFDFTRFGVRVPTVLVSPLIEAGTIFRVPAGSVPFDHTSILKTIEQRWSLPPLTARDAAAPGVGAVLTLSAPRTDDPLVGVTVPVSRTPNPSAAIASHLVKVHAELVSRLRVGDIHEPVPRLETSEDYLDFIRTRTAAWVAGRTAR